MDIVCNIENFNEKFRYFTFQIGEWRTQFLGDILQFVYMIV